MSPLLQGGTAMPAGASNVLFDVSLPFGNRTQPPDANGMGKSTLVKMPAWLAQNRALAASFNGRPVAGAPAHVIGNLGLGLVPEGRQVSDAHRP